MGCEAASQGLWPLTFRDKKTVHHAPASLRVCSLDACVFGQQAGVRLFPQEIHPHANAVHICCSFRSRRFPKRQLPFTYDVCVSCVCVCQPGRLTSTDTRYDTPGALGGESSGERRHERRHAQCDAATSQGHAPCDAAMPHPRSVTRSRSAWEEFGRAVGVLVSHCLGRGWCRSLISYAAPPCRTRYDRRKDSGHAMRDDAPLSLGDIAAHPRHPP